MSVKDKVDELVSKGIKEVTEKVEAKVEKDIQSKISKVRENIADQLEKYLKLITEKVLDKVLNLLLKLLPKGVKDKFFGLTSKVAHDLYKDGKVNTYSLIAPAISKVRGSQGS